MNALTALAINFSDIFRSEFLGKFTDFSITDSLIALAVSFAIGLFIYFIYVRTFAGVVYSGSFNLSLIAMTMITTLIILGVTSNIVLSLGMVGALSIVRFRSAIKEPMDIVFIFWAIGEGILCGAGLIPLALIGAPIIGVLLLVFQSRHDFSSPYLLIVRLDNSKNENKVTALVTKQAKRCRVKSKTVSGSDGMEIIYEVRLKEADSELIKRINDLENVTYASLVSYDGNFTP